MTIQLLKRHAILCNFVVALPEPIQASSRDYGFDFDGEELARELIAHLPDGFSREKAPEVQADEFEKIFHFFFS
jgi:hypothetical protein